MPSRLSAAEAASAGASGGAPQRGAPADVGEPRLGRYLALEKRTLAGVTATGLLYNAGLAAVPWLEGRLAQRLADVISGTAAPAALASLALVYVLSVLAVQGARFLKRLFVRKFANNTSRRMKNELYGSIVSMPRERAASEGAGGLMTKAASDVDDCVEGMRKLTTEVFDTGVALAAYAALLLASDWRLALVAMAFPPLSYLLAEFLKGRVVEAAAATKRAMSDLGAMAQDRVEGALTYRSLGLEGARDQELERSLGEYERAAARSGCWAGSPEPLYKAISLSGMLPVLWLGAGNVLGVGWQAWDIAAFTTFASCFTRLAVKSSHAAKLFNAVQKARVSWERIRPLMPGGEAARQETAAGGGAPLPGSGLRTGSGSRPGSETRAGSDVRPAALEARGLSVFWPVPDGGLPARPVLSGVSFRAEPGQVVGVTGRVASGKTSLGLALIGEAFCEGELLYGGCDLRGLAASGQKVAGYLGHDPELLGDTLEENVRLGAGGAEAEVWAALRAACLDEEVAAFPDGLATQVGEGGVRLSGGQAARLGLARALFHWRPLLVLDDPFSAVDLATERRMLGSLRSMCSDTGAAVVLISHRLELFGELDGVVLLEGGRAVSGTHAGLLESCPSYAALVGARPPGAGGAGEGADRPPAGAGPQGGGQGDGGR